MIPFFSRMFPGTNLQDLNLDWICRRIMELSKGIIAPWINPDNKDWMVYDTETEQFVDSGVSAAPLGDLPAGGTTGQVLAKSSDADYAIVWEDAPQSLPAGGTLGQVLTKTGSADYAAAWRAAPAKSLVFNGVTLQNPGTPPGQLCDIADSNITANFNVVNIEVSNPDAVYTNLTWTTSSGHCIITGQLTATVTATVFLVEKIN